MNNKIKNNNQTNLETVKGNDGYDKMILSENYCSTFNSNETGLNNNILVMGATGSGKSMSISEPQIMNTFNNSIVTTLTKRVIADRYTNLLRSRGYTVDILDTTKPWLSTVRFDPFNYMFDETDILLVAEQIVASGNEHDPYWKNAGITLICAEIAALIESWEHSQKNHTNDSPEPNLANLLELHRRLEFTETARSDVTISSLDGLYNKLELQDPNSYAVRCYKSVKGLAAKTVSCIKSIVDVAYSNTFTPKIVAVSQQNRAPLEVFDLGRKKSALFIITSPVEKSVKYYSNIVYSILFRNLFDLAESSDDYRLPVPVHFICDDFACGAPMPNFADYISVIRSAGMSVALMLQSESQLSSLYGQVDATTILNNCDRTVYLGGTDITTCTTIARRANVPLDTVLNMPTGKVYVFERGRKPEYSDRYHTLEDPVWIMMNDAHQASHVK